MMDETSGDDDLRVLPWAIFSFAGLVAVKREKKQPDSLLFVKFHREKFEISIGEF